MADYVIWFMCGYNSHSPVIIKICTNYDDDDHNSGNDDADGDDFSR
jgi:hypothetical protein